MSTDPENRAPGDEAGDEADEMEPAFVDPENMGDAQVVADLDEDDEGPPLSDDDSEQGEEPLEARTDVMELDGPVFMSPDEIGPDDSINVLTAHSDAVMRVAWHPCNPSILASGACDDKAVLWKLEGHAAGAGLDKVELLGHTDTVNSLAFSWDGAYLATGGLDGKVLIWDAEGSKIQSLEGPAEGVEFVAWHPRGPVVLAGCEDFSAWMWNAVSGACMQVFTGHGGAVNCGAFTPDGKAVVTGSVDGSLRAWDPRSGACSFTVQGHPFHEGGLTSLDINSDGGLVVSGSEDKTARVVSMSSGKVKGALTGHLDSVECVGFSPVQPLIATGSMDGTVNIWDMRTLALRSTLKHGNMDGVVALTWFPSSPLLLSACLDARVRVWDARTGTCVRDLGGHAAGVQDVAVRFDEMMLASASDDYTLRTFTAAKQ